jgi:hypothetical protein
MHFSCLRAKDLAEAEVNDTINLPARVADKPSIVRSALPICYLGTFARTTEVT